MEICEHCPYPHRCGPQERCIAYKIGGEGDILPEPVEVRVFHPVMTTDGIGMTGKIKSGKKKAKKNAKL